MNEIVDVSDEKNFRELHSLKVGDQPRSLASSLNVSWNKVKGTYYSCVIQC
ncbi:hypothetical protein T01_6573 [Trichinella spiralis]|uniref:Uncharacterized protein n=1 Tax=Trichinella spiralis TaxID=6334 RepID=A0A0V0YYA1_TRISP|nr:hypothetical protein T01_6573 [Trichinella spiralis]